MTRRRAERQMEVTDDPPNEGRTPTEATDNTIAQVLDSSSVDKILESIEKEGTNELNQSMPSTQVQEPEVLITKEMQRRTPESYPEVQSLITVGAVSPRNFDGSTDVDEYIDHFTFVSKCNNWDDRMQKRRLPVHLKDVAEMWYREFFSLGESKDINFGNNLSITEIFDGLRSAFRPKNYRSINQSALICRHQGLQEPVGTYHYDMLRLCNKMNPKMDEIEKMTHIMRGLRSGLLEKVLVHEPKDCNDLLGKLRSIEEAEILSSQRPTYNYFLMKDSSNQKPVAAEVSIPQNKDNDDKSEMKQMFSKMCDMIEGLVKNNRNDNYPARSFRRYNRTQFNRTVDGRPICNICRVPGHIARSCPQNRNNVPAVTGNPSTGNNLQVMPVTENQ